MTADSWAEHAECREQFARELKQGRESYTAGTPEKYPAATVTVNLLNAEAFLADSAALLDELARLRAQNDRWPCGCVKSETQHGAGWSDCEVQPAWKKLRAERDAAEQSAKERLDLAYRIENDCRDQRDRADAAETRAAEWLTPFDGSGIAWHEGLPSPYTYQASDFSKLVAAVHEYESRALTAEARVEQLTEALQRIVKYPYADSVPAARGMRVIARAVLVGDSTPEINPERPPEHVFEEFREMHGVGDSE